MLVRLMTRLGVNLQGFWTKEGPLSKHHLIMELPVVYMNSCHYQWSLSPGSTSQTQHRSVQ